MQGFRAVVVSPTRELAQQVCAAVIVVCKIYLVFTYSVLYCSNRSGCIFALLISLTNGIHHTNTNISVKLIDLSILCDFQIYHEFCHLSQGRMFRIHLLTKAKASSNSFGSKSCQRFGKSSEVHCNILC